MKELRELLLIDREQACDCSATSTSSRRSWNSPRRYRRSAGSLFRPSRSGCCCSSRGPQEGRPCSPRPRLSLLREERLALQRGRPDLSPAGPAPPRVRGLTSIRVGALRRNGGSDTVHPYPLYPQLLQLPFQVPLLPLQLVYLVYGFPVVVFKLLQRTRQRERESSLSSPASSHARDIAFGYPSRLNPTAADYRGAPPAPTRSGRRARESYGFNFHPPASRRTSKQGTASGPRPERSGPGPRPPEKAHKGRFPLQTVYMRGYAGAGPILFMYFQCL